MNSDKDAILVDFQVCTGIEDFDESIRYLEKNDWDLIKSVNDAFNKVDDIEIDDTSLQNHPSLDSNSINKPRIINFHINYNGKVSLIKVLESQKIDKLKQYISDRFKVNMDEIELSGWTNDTTLSSLSLPDDNYLKLKINTNPKRTDKIHTIEITSDLTVKQLKDLISNVTNIPSYLQSWIGFENEICRESNKIKELGFDHINELEVTQKKVENLDNGSRMDLLYDDSPSFLPSTHVSTKSKNVIISDDDGEDGDFLDSSDILPPALKLNSPIPTFSSKRNNNDTLSFSNDTKPHTHNNKTNKNASSNNDNHSVDKKIPSKSSIPESAKAKNAAKPLNISSTSEEDHTSDIECLYEDTSMHDDDSFNNSTFGYTPQTSHTPLILPHTNDIKEGHEHFISQYEKRYGKIHPKFFVGTLKAALDQSCNLPILERKLLLIYLHHDKSILANIFCSINLTSEMLINYLDNHFIVWPWDMTHESNRDLFLQMASSKFGKTFENTIRNLKINEYPTLIIFQKCRGQYEMLNIFKGNNSIQDLMTMLIHSEDVFKHYQETALQEEMERDMRENIKREQDEAYRLSLEADKAKKVAKEREFEQEQLEQQIKHAENEYKLKEKEAIRQSLIDTLPIEPPKTCNEPISVIKIRAPNIAPSNKPDGEKDKGAAVVYQRRFLATHTLQNLLDYITSLGYDKADYKFMTYWPNCDISTLNPNSTLKELNLYPQVALTITERDL